MMYHLILILLYQAVEKPYRLFLRHNPRMFPQRRVDSLYPSDLVQH